MDDQNELMQKLRDVGKRAESQLELLQNEEATKTALVMPFISALGYDVFNVRDVMPEFTADVGTKKGEKVDYAILKDGRPVILFECKKAGTDLDEVVASQLYRYFSVTPARIGILTDGIIYRFYSDLEEANKMDSRWFFEFDIRKLNEKHIEELSRFRKQTFDIDTLLSTASDLKYKRAIKRLLNEEWQNPSEEFIRAFASRAYSGRLTAKVMESFSSLVRSALHEFVTDRVNDRLRTALAQSAKADEPAEKPAESHHAQADEDANRQTEDEIEAFRVVRAILAEICSPKRIYIREQKRFTSILLDDSNRRVLCRLAFTDKRKELVLLDHERNNVRHEIEDISDIYRFSAEIKTACMSHGVGAPAQTPKVEGA